MQLYDKSLLTEAQESLRLFPVPGLTAAVLRGGVLTESCALGTRNDMGAPMTEDTLFEAASLTKSLFATLYLRLCGRGVVSLDTPIADQTAGEPWSADPRYRDITPRMALSHGSGLPNWARKPMSLRFTPGQGFSYSGEGYYLLQHLAEEKTGLSLPALFRQEFFGPWGLNADAVWSPEIGARMSLGFDHEGEVCKCRDGLDLEGNAPEPNAAWSLYANARIYAEFLRRMISERGGLTEELFSAMTTRQNDAGGQIFWGLGWGIPAADPDVLWHWGDNTGFKSFALWDKRTGDGLTVFTNSDLGPHYYMELCRRMTDARFFPEIENFITHAE